MLLGRVAQRVVVALAELNGRQRVALQVRQVATRLERLVRLVLISTLLQVAHESTKTLEVQLEGVLDLAGALQQIRAAVPHVARPANAQVLRVGCVVVVAGGGDGGGCVRVQ